MKNISISRVMEAIRRDMSHISAIMAANREYKKNDSNSDFSDLSGSRVDEDETKMTGVTLEMSQKKGLFAKFQKLGGDAAGEKLMIALNNMREFIDLDKSNNDLIQNNSDRRNEILKYLIDVEESIVDFFQVIDNFKKQNPREKFNIPVLFNLDVLNKFYDLINQKIEIIFSNIANQAKYIVKISELLHKELTPVNYVKTFIKEEYNPSGKYNIYISIFEKMVSPSLVVEFFIGLKNEDLNLDKMKQKFINFLNEKKQTLSDMVDDLNSRVSAVKAVNPTEKYTQRLKILQINISKHRIEIEKIISEKVKTLSPLKSQEHKQTLNLKALSINQASDIKDKEEKLEIKLVPVNRKTLKNANEFCIGLNDLLDKMKSESNALEEPHLLLKELGCQELVNNFYKSVQEEESEDKIKEMAGKIKLQASQIIMEILLNRPAEKIDRILEKFKNIVDNIAMSRIGELRPRRFYDNFFDKKIQLFRTFLKNNPKLCKAEIIIFSASFKSKVGKEVKEGNGKEFYDSLGRFQEIIDEETRKETKGRTIYPQDQLSENYLEKRRVIFLQEISKIEDWLIKIEKNYPDFVNQRGFKNSFLDLQEKIGKLRFSFLRDKISLNEPQLFIEKIEKLENYQDKMSELDGIFHDYLEKINLEVTTDLSRYIPLKNQEVQRTLFRCFSSANGELIVAKKLLTSLKGESALPPVTGNDIRLIKGDPH